MKHLKNHIAFKFIALLLAAVCLLSLVASAACIIALGSAGLYERTVYDLQEEQTQSIRRDFSVNLVHRYASLSLGKLPEAYLDQYYGNDWYYNTFTYGTFFYEIRNELGEVVESTLSDAPSGTSDYTITVTDLRYRRIIHEIVDDPTTADSARDAAPAYKETEPGTTATTEPDSVTENTTESTGETIVESFDAETSFDVSVGTEAARFSITYDEEIHTSRYYDFDLGDYVEIRWQVVLLPPYTVELRLLPSATFNENSWALLETVWNIRTELFYILAVSTLLFAALLVYLCCSAGRDPKREGVHAEGFNRLPIDLYLLADGVLLFIGFYVGLLGCEYLIDHSMRLLLAFAAADGLFCSLLIVGLIFAFAAQIKMPGGYCRKNTVISRTISLAVRMIRAAWRITRSIFSNLPQFFLNLLDFTKKFILFLLSPVQKLFHMITGQILRLYALLPLTWQWICAGAIMLGAAVLAFFMLMLGNVPMFLILCCVCIAVLLYGAHCFGILLEGTKHMRSGDLDNKIDDAILTGAFRDFSEDLNALSEVAIVAAQKQMKAERMKTELITNVSHDIKTPLTSIINYVDLLEKPHTEQEQTQYLEVLSRQSQRLKKLIEDLMEMSKASTGNLSVDITRIDAAEAINQALGEFSDKLERAELTPVFRTPETPLFMLADGRLVWRVLSNLLSNAVKYALPGTRLYIDLMELDGKVVISLKNISRDALNVSADELLERFVRGDSSRNTEGSGLGLNIAQSLTELQKGSLTLLVDGDLFKVTLFFPAAS